MLHYSLICSGIVQGLVAGEEGEEARSGLEESREGWEPAGHLAEGPRSLRRDAE